MALKLKAEPTFKAQVKIPLAGGGESEPVEFTFKHRTRTELDEFFEKRKKSSNLDAVLDMVLGWNLTDEFNRDNVALLLDNYGAATLAITDVYTRELLGLRLGN